jgi:hypothetical protein
MVPGTFGSVIGVVVEEAGEVFDAVDGNVVVEGGGVIGFAGGVVVVTGTVLVDGRFKDIACAFVAAKHRKRPRKKNGRREPFTFFAFFMQLVRISVGFSKWK